MTKRKIDSTLDDFIDGYLKKAKYEKSLKLFEGKIGRKKNVKIFEQFMNYLMRKEAEKANENDDLGFEINFGQSQAKVHSVSRAKNRLWTMCLTIRF